MTVQLHSIVKGLDIRSEDLSTNAYVLQGTGAPGSRTVEKDAPIGSLYLQSDAAGDDLHVWWKYRDLNNDSTDWFQAASKTLVDALVLDDLVDVAYTGSPAPVTNDILQFNGTSWTNVPLSALDRLVRISANDTTSGFLNGKLVSGVYTSLTENFDGANETLTVDLVPSTLTLDLFGDVTYVGSPAPAVGDQLEWNGSAWVNISPSNVTQNIFETIVGDGATSTVASGPTDTLSILGGSGITTTAGASPNILTIDLNINELASVSGSPLLSGTDEFVLYDGVNNFKTTLSDIATTVNTLAGPNLFETFTADAGSTTADIRTDTLTVTGGVAASTSITGDTLTINVDASEIDIEDLGNVILVGSPAPAIGDTLSWNGTAWENMAPAALGGLDIFKTIFGDTGSTTAFGTADTLSIFGGVGITTSANGSPANSITIDIDTSDINFEDLNNITPPAGSPTYGASGVSYVLVSDGAGGLTVTETSTGGQFCEDVQDIVGGMIGTTTDITVTYVDGAGTCDGTITYSVDDVFLRNTGDILTSGTLEIASGATLLIKTGASFVIEQNATATIETPTGNFNAANQIVNKEYVDSVAAGFDPKESVRTCTTAPLNGTPASGSPAGFGTTITIAGSTLTLDTISLANGDRILVKDGVGGSPVQNQWNGIYVVSGIGTGPVVLTRAEDMDGTPNSEVSGGNFTFVEEGATCANTGWVVSSPNGIADVDVDDLFWTQFSGAGAILGDVGIAQIGTTLALDLDITEVAAATPALADRIAFHDDDGATQSPTGTKTYGATFSDTFNALDVVYGVTGSGHVVRTGEDTYATRALDANATHTPLTGSPFDWSGLEGISIAYADGVGGNPQIGLDISGLTSVTGSPLLSGTDEFVFTDGTNNFKVALSDIANTANSLAGPNLWETISSDSGSTTADTRIDTLTVTGGVAASTSITGDTLTINVDASEISIEDLSNVILQGSPAPVTGDVFEWNGTAWTNVPATSLDLDIFRTVSGDTGSAIASGTTDTLTVAGGFAATTSVAGSTLTVDVVPSEIDLEDLGNVSQNGSPIPVGYVLTWDGTIWHPENIDALMAAIVAGPGIDVVTAGSPAVTTVSLDICTTTSGSTATLDASDEIAVCDGGSTVKFSFSDIFNKLDVAFGIPGAGVVVKTGGSPDTYATRTIEESTASGEQGLTVTDGDGITGNPTVGLDLAGLTSVVGSPLLSATDEFVIYDGVDNLKTTLSDLAAATNDLAGPNLFETFTSDAGSTTADTRTDTLTVTGGVAASTSITGDTLTINVDASEINIEDLSNVVLTGSPAPVTNDVLQFNGTNWTNVPLSEVDKQNLFETVAGDSGTAVADSPTDTLTIAGGSGITTSGATTPDTVTIDLDIAGLTSVSGSPLLSGTDEFVLYDGVGNFKTTLSDIATAVNDLAGPNLFETISSDAGSTTADTRTDTLTITGGFAATTSVSGDTLTIDVVPSEIDLGDLGDVTYNGSPGSIPTGYVLTWNGTIWEPQDVASMVAGIAEGPGIDVTTAGSPAVSTISLDICTTTPGNTATLNLTDQIAVCDGTSTVKFSFADIFDTLDVPSGITTAGIVVKTVGSPDTYATREVIASTNEDLLGANVVNGDGAAGDIEVGVTIDTLTDPGANLAATDEFIIHDKSEGTGGANRKITGQNVADGVINIAGLNGLSIRTIGGTGSPGQTHLFIEDETRGSPSKTLSIAEFTLTWNDNSADDLKWVRIGSAMDADVGYVVPMDATIVRATAQTADATGNSKAFDLYIDGSVADSGFLTLAGTGQQEDSDFTLNIDVNAGEKLRIRGGSTGGKIEDVVIALWLRWRA